MPDMTDEQINTDLQGLSEVWNIDLPKLYIQFWEIYNTFTKDCDFVMYLTWVTCKFNHLIEAKYVQSDLSWRWN